MQQLKEQRVLVARLAADEAKARKAGVEGTQEVVSAKERLKDAVDPAGILAPGKQGVWPARYRTEG